jgi:hypothetical protein
MSVAKSRSSPTVGDQSNVVHLLVKRIDKEMERLTYEQQREVWAALKR